MNVDLQVVKGATESRWYLRISTHNGNGDNATADVVGPWPDKSGPETLAMLITKGAEYTADVVTRRPQK